MNFLTYLVSLTYLSTLMQVMPHVTVDLRVASHTLQQLFDQLITYDTHQARGVLDQSLLSVNDLGKHRRQLDEMMTRNGQLCEAHISNCQIAARNFRRGQNGADILQTLIIDHLVLSQSTKEERAFLLEMMFSVYLDDVATPTEFPAIPWSDDAMAALMTEHAVNKGYYTWQEFLLNRLE